MQITSTRPSLSQPIKSPVKSADVPSTAPEQNQDQVTFSGADSGGSSSTLGSIVRTVGRFAGNTLLAAAPAIATTVAMATGGPNAAGLALAGSILGGGAVSALLNSKELGARNAFTVGGTAALIGAASGMIAGPAGIAMSAGMGAVWSGVRQIGEYIHS